MADPVNFRRVAASVREATVLIDRAHSIAMMNGDATDFQNRAARELRAAADVLDPPVGGSRG